MKTLIIKLLGKTFAPIAFLAGYAIGRPTSGRWLAHYFWGSGESIQLPPKMEEQIAAWLSDDGHCSLYSYLTHARPYITNPRWYDERDKNGECAELDYVPRDRKFSFVFVNDNDCGNHKDIFTTIGSFVIWENDDGTITYLDVYDWQSGFSWAFDVSLPFLPFSFTVRGKDSMLNGLGRSFVTTGVVRK